MNIYLPPSKLEFKQFVDTKTKTADSQLLPTKGFKKLTIPAFIDHHTTPTIIFALADTNYNIFGSLFLQTYCETIDTEHSCLVLKNKLSKAPGYRWVSLRRPNLLMMHFRKMKG